MTQAIALPEPPEDIDAPRVLLSRYAAPTNDMESQKLVFTLHFVRAEPFVSWWTGYQFLPVDQNLAATRAWMTKQASEPWSFMVQRKPDREVIGYAAIKPSAKWEEEGTGELKLFKDEQPGTGMRSVERKLKGLSQAGAESDAAGPASQWPELRIVIAAAHKGQGYGSEAVKALAKAAVEAGMEGVKSSCHEENTRAEKMLRNGGFEEYLRDDKQIFVKTSKKTAKKDI